MLEWGTIVAHEAVYHANIALCVLCIFFGRRLGLDWVPGKAGLAMKICILGAGVVGLTSAWWLAEAGHQVIIVDRHATAGSEASAANGAQLSYSFVAPMASPAMLRKLPGMFLGGEDAIRVS